MVEKKDDQMAAKSAYVSVVGTVASMALDYSCNLKKVNNRSESFITTNNYSTLDDAQLVDVMVEKTALSSVEMMAVRLEYDEVEWLGF